MRKLMKYGLFSIGVLLLLATISIGYHSPNVSAADDKFKVAFVYDGAIGDAGWIYAHEQGRRYLEKMLPNVQATFIESVPENADAERVLTELAEKGNKVIFAASFGYMDYVQKVAAKYPNVIFEHCGGYKTAKNVGTYFGRDYEGLWINTAIYFLSVRLDISPITPYNPFCYFLAPTGQIFLCRTINSQSL